jgi:hypothetical protein|mmetsp:Transcript_51361/g.85737  ORF Transcript_51361/g.85737 Transcript_51361/m.85737 type:complete len:201 (-) Transcript_51361:253-855(-)
MGSVAGHWSSASGRLVRIPALHKCTTYRTKRLWTVVAPSFCGATDLAPVFFQDTECSIVDCVVCLRLHRSMWQELHTDSFPHAAHPPTTASCAAPALCILTSFPSLDALYICMACRWGNPCASLVFTAVFLPSHVRRISYAIGKFCSVRQKYHRVALRHGVWSKTQHIWSRDTEYVAGAMDSGPQNPDRLSASTPNVVGD